MPAGPTHVGGDHDRPVLALEAEEQCNSMWLSFDVVCVRVCFAFCGFRPFIPSLWLFGRAVAWEKEVSFDFENRKIGIGMGYGIGKE